MKSAVIVSSVLVLTILVSTVAIYFFFPHDNLSSSTEEYDVDWNKEQAYIGCMCFNEQECQFHTCSSRSYNEHIIIGDDVNYRMESIDFSMVGQVRAVVVGDVDSDGFDDVVACGRSEHEIFVFLNKEGTGEDFTLVTLEQESFCDTCRDLNLVDIDNDGDLDIAFASQETNKIGWFENPVVSSDASEWNQHIITRNATKVAQVKVGDINNDGLLDWVTASFCEGDCGIPCDNIPPAMMESIAEDTNSDLDVVCKALYAPLPTGYNSFHAWVQLPEPGPDGEPQYQYILLGEDKIGAFALYIDDSQDGPATIYGAVRNAEGSKGNVVKYEMIDGVWTEAIVYDKAEYGLMGPDYLLHADVNLDGALDLLVVSREADGVAWLEEVSDEEQWLAHDIANGLMDGPKHLDYADVDGDGDLDVTAGGFFDDTFSWFENPTIPSAATDANEGRWVQYKINQCSWGPSVAAFADLNHDGKIDIIGASMDDGKLSWWDDVKSMTSPSTQAIISMQGKVASNEEKFNLVKNRVFSA